jgi:hypothetical protein
LTSAITAEENDMGSKSSGQTTTVQQADPWSGQQPFLTDIFNEAQRLYRSAGPSYYPSQTTAGFSPQELQAQGNITQYAQGGARDLTNQGLQSQSFLLGDVLRADSNPYMADYASGAIAPVWDALTRVGLPGVQGGAVASGQYGGSRQGLAEGLALSDATRQSFDTTARMYNDMYNTNLGAMQRAVALNPSMVQSGALPDQLLAGVGTERRAMDQAMIDDAVAKWEWEQALPSTKLAQYMSTIQGSYGGQSSAKTSGDVGGASTGGKIAGAAMTGLGTYGLLSSATASGGALAGIVGTAAVPWLAGAVALASMFAS